MAELRAAARRPGAVAASASGYGDVFGGPPRYGARLGDYDDVFGGVSSSCSIPVLDLPPAPEPYDAPRRSALDYGEIFAGLEAGRGVPTYEELVAAQERAQAGIAAARSRKEIEPGQQTTTGVRQLPPGHANKNHAACLEKDRIISTANYSNGCSVQHDIPYYKPSQGDIEEAVDETTQITQPCVFHGFTSDIDASQPSQRIRTDVPPYMANVDISLSASSNGRISDQKQADSFSSSSSATSSKSSGNGPRLNQTQFAPKHPTLVDGPANTKHHSRSSSNHSTSSGDMYYPDFTYVSVSDISLQTQPAQKPPPSRSPPKLANNQEISKMKINTNSKVDPDEASLSKPILNHRKHNVLDAPKRLAPQVPPRDSSFFFDVEVDANSAAAASAAAMKEAMEQAQARLKSAKESMERKRDNLQSRKKMGRNEGTKCENRKDVKPTREIKMFNEVENQKIISKEKKRYEFVPEARQKAGEVAKVALEDDEKERLVASYEQDQQIVQPKGFTSSQACCKLDDRTGEWKIDEQFYELVHNEKNFNVVTEPSVKKIAEKVPEETRNVEFEIECKASEFSSEFERNENLLKVSETQKFEEKKSKAGDRAFVEEKKELPKTSSKIFVQEETENRLEKVCDFHVPVEDESKPGQNQEAYAREEEIKKPKFAKDIPACRESNREADVKLEYLSDVCNSEATDANIENVRKLEVKKEACDYDTNLELNKDHVTCLSHDSEQKSEMTNKNDMQAENDEIKVTYASCTLEARDEEEADPEMNPYKDSSKAREKTTLDCSQEENGKKLKGPSSVSEQHESIILNTTEYASAFVESNFNVEVAEEACETEENLEELQSAEMGIRSRKTEMIEAVEWEDYDENEATDAQLELEQDANEQTKMQVPCEPLANPLLSVAVRVPEKENDGTGEIHLNVDMKDKYNIYNMAQEVLRRVVNKDVEAFREAKMFENKDKIPTSSQNTTEVCPYVRPGHSVSDMWKVEEKKKERRIQREEREKAKMFEKKDKMSTSSQNTTEVCPYVRPEQSVSDLWKVEEKKKERQIQREELEKVRRLEEERERESEREKDRIAVERATREAHERSVAEAREKAERIAVERVTAEARQRALAEAREKAEKASAEALERSLTEKSARESRLRAERAAVERATAEARERAAERALSEKAAADARGRAEKLNAASTRDKTRRGNETEAHSRARFKADSGTRDPTDLTHDMQYKNQRHMDSYDHGEGESALRCKARLERHQRTVERAAKALAEKNTRDILAQREQAERNRLAEMLDADVRRWSTGKEGNLRALLSTLQYILGPESGWQPIPLTDVITAAAVKKGYRKATLCVHPDKLQQRGANIQQKYICEKVFDLLKDAWNRFNSEER